MKKWILIILILSVIFCLASKLNTKTRYEKMVDATVFIEDENGLEGFNTNQLIIGDIRVDRGYLATWDFDINDLILDDKWHWLDLSHIVPPEAKRVEIFVVLNAPQANSLVEFSEFPSPGLNVDYVRTQEANVNNQETMTINFPPGETKIAYSSWGIAIRPIYQCVITVKGWWI